MGKEVCIVKKAFLRAAVLAAALILTLSISPAARGESAVFSIFSEVTISPLSRAYGDANPCGSARDISRALRLAAIACAFPYG